MQIEIKCFATLAHFAPADGVMQIANGSSVEQTIAALNIPLEEVKIIFINGKHVEPDTLLTEGDRLGLFPAVGGG